MKRASDNCIQKSGWYTSWGENWVDVTCTERTLWDKARDTNRHRIQRAWRRADSFATTVIRWRWLSFGHRRDEEAASTSETSAHFYQTTRRNNPEDSHLHTRLRENLKSHTYFLLIWITINSWRSWSLLVIWLCSCLFSRLAVCRT
jgi:hypothetical protein